MGWRARLAWWWHGLLVRLGLRPVPIIGLSASVHPRPGRAVYVCRLCGEEYTKPRRSNEEESIVHQCGPETVGVGEFVGVIMTEEE